MSAVTRMYIVCVPFPRSVHIIRYVWYLFKSSERPCVDECIIVITVNQIFAGAKMARKINAHLKCPFHSPECFSWFLFFYWIIFSNTQPAGQQNVNESPVHLIRPLTRLVVNPHSVCVWVIMLDLLLSCGIKAFPMILFGAERLRNGAFIGRWLVIFHSL